MIDDDNPVEEPKSRSRKFLPGCLASIVLFSLCAGLVVGGIFYFTRDVAAQGEAFMTALTNEDYVAAYSILTPQVQQEVGSAENFERSIFGNNVVPIDWNVRSRSVENGLGEIGGSVTYSDGFESNYVLKLHQIDGTWRVYLAELPRQ